MKEEELFVQIRKELCNQDKNISSGKMMHAEAIIYQGNVFAFFSKEKKMVFKLGKAYDTSSDEVELTPFNPFKNKGPLAGWFELPYTSHKEWLKMAKESLARIKSE